MDLRQPVVKKGNNYLVTFTEVSWRFLTDGDRERQDLTVTWFAEH